MSDLKPEQRLAMLYVIWLRENGLEDSEFNFTRFLVWLEHQSQRGPVTSSSNTHSSILNSTGMHASSSKAADNQVESPSSSSGGIGSWLAGIAVAIGIIVILVATTAKGPSTSSSTNGSSTSGSTSTSQTFSQPRSPMPSHGTSTCWSSTSAPSWLSVQTSSSSGSYFVKLESASGAELCHFVIGAGRSLTVGVPTGTYYLKYASGSSWYGYTHLFGPEGSYARASESFPFTSGSGWDVELILRPGGNLGTSKMSYSDF